MNISDATFIFTVGGNECHYENMNRCIRSIVRHYENANFLILEFGSKLTSSPNKQVVNLEGVVDFNSGKKVGYIIWKHKYVASLMIKTKYGIYVDTDTVLVNPNIEQILSILDGGIGVTRHFWVPNISLYQSRACTESTYSDFLKTKEKIGLKDESPFFAGGVYMFENNENTSQVFREVLQMYEEYYSDKDYVRSITDELFLAASLNKHPELVRLFSGAINHCSMGDENMPLAVKDSILYGRNSFENIWQPVTFLHCDISRRDPSEKYDGEIRDIIRSSFELKA